MLGRQDSNYVSTDDLRRESEYIEHDAASRYDVPRFNLHGKVKEPGHSSRDTGGCDLEKSEYVVANPTASSTKQSSQPGYDGTCEVGAETEDSTRPSSDIIYENPFLNEPQEESSEPNTTRIDEDSMCIYANLTNSTTKQSSQPEYVNKLAEGAEPADSTRPSSEYVYANPFLDEVGNSEENTATTDQDPVYMNANLKTTTTKQSSEDEYVKADGVGDGIQPGKREYVNTGQGYSQQLDSNVERESEYSYASHSVLRSLRGPPAPSGNVQKVPQAGIVRPSPIRKLEFDVMPDGSEYVEPTPQEAAYEDQEGIYSKPKT